MKHDQFINFLKKAITVPNYLSRHFISLKYPAIPKFFLITLFLFLQK